MKNALKTLLAVLLLHTLFLAAAQTARLLYGTLGNIKMFACFAGGAAVYGAIHFWVYDFSRVYVLGHELTHAVAALLCGYRIKDISVRQDSGYVKMTQCNAFVALAPYFIPAYTVALGFLYCALTWVADLTPYRWAFVALAGFCTAFHFVQTFKTLFEADQPDLKMAGGKVFSAVSITFVNLMILAVLCKVLFPQQTNLSDAALRVATGTYQTWRIFVNYIIERIYNAL